MLGFAGSLLYSDNHANPSLSESGFTGLEDYFLFGQSCKSYNPVNPDSDNTSNNPAFYTNNNINK